MKRIILILSLYITTSYAQIPDPQNTAVIKQLQVIIKQNMFRNTQLKKDVVTGIRAARSALRSARELQQLNEYQKRLRRDLKNLKNFNFLDLNFLESFILEGDRLDFYLSSTSYKLMGDIERLSDLTNDANTLARKVGLGNDADILAMEKQIDLESGKMNRQEKQDYEKMYFLTKKAAEEVKNKALSTSTEMTEGERIQALLDAYKLALKAAEYQLKASKNTQESAKEITDKQKMNSINKSISQKLKEFYENVMKEPKRYGLFDSPHIRAEVLK